MQAFENDLRQKLLSIAAGYDVNVEIYDEQIFSKQALKPGTIYCVLKYLATTLTYNIGSTPIQMIVLAEANNLAKAKEILEQFATTYNWLAFSSNGVFYKPQYSTPVVLSNFNEVGYEFVTALYMNINLITIANAPDVSNFKIKVNNVTYDIEPMNFQISYQATADTQQMAGSNIANSVKTVSTVSIAFQITSVVQKVSGVDTTIPDFYNIIKGTNTGNTTFQVTFSIGTTNFSYNMILISYQQVFTPNEAPTIRIGMMQ